MKTIYAYNKKNGKFLGGFSEENDAIPKNCGITEKAPTNAKQIFEKGEWIFPVEVEIEEKKSDLILSRKDFLKSTDWYLAREQDEPNSYPSEIKAKRILARKEIKEIKDCLSLEQLNNYKSEF